MDKTKRIILYVTAGIIFITAVPVLLMYGLGYTYNLKKHKIEFDGGMYLRFEPNNALVTINGVPYHKESPFELNDLRPGDYHVTLSSPSYLPWSKMIRVDPLQIVTFPSINLFPDVLPERVGLTQIPTLLKQRQTNAPLSKFSITSAPNGLRVLFTETQASTTVPLATSTMQFIISDTQTAVVYDEPSKRLALVDGSRQSLSTRVFEDVNNVAQTKNITLFWTPYELWSIPRGVEQPLLVTRVSDGIIEASIFDESHILYVTEHGSLYAIESLNLFGRVNQLLASFFQIESIQVLDDKLVYIRGRITEPSEPGWFSLRLK